MSTEKKTDLAAKKRTLADTLFNPRKKYEFPKWAQEDKTHGFRWIASRHLEAATEGYESRGWAVAKDPEGKIVRRDEDLVLACMPIDEYRLRQEIEQELKDKQTESVLQAQAAREEQLTHEFKKLGGKTKFTFTQE